AGIPFVMDLRDPWSLVERLADGFASPHWFWLARRFEPEAVARASLVVMNTDPARRAMAGLYPGLADRIITVMNGFDEDGHTRPQPQTSQFRMVFAGSVYLDRDPGLILRAVARLVAELKLEPRDFRIEFVGNVGSVDPDDPASIGWLARAEGVAGFVSVSGFRPRSELATLLADATMLVSLYQDSRMAIPSKIFDYMQYDAWLLAFAEAGSATAEVLRGTDADVVDPQDREALFQVLARRYAQFRAGQRPVRMASDPRLSRRGQATRLFERLEELAALPRPTHAPHRGR
ncbi:MAG TPA: hypothetical protein VMJ30_04630, partial [Gemmatimonadales bacterium]|nr:hypothetical protein [Gemmatimonadales bacterium]